MSHWCSVTLGTEVPYWDSIPAGDTLPVGTLFMNCDCDISQIWAIRILESFSPRSAEREQSGCSISAFTVTRAFVMYGSLVLSRIVFAAFLPHVIALDIYVEGADSPTISSAVTKNRRRPVIICP